MSRIRTVSVCALALVFGWVFVAAVGRADGVTLPQPLGKYHSTLLATDAGNHLFACDGDTLYRFNGTAFSPLYTGLVSLTNAAAGDDVGVDPSGFSVSADGTRAYLATGNSGRLLEINLTSLTARDLPGTTGGWVYGNYGVAVDPIYGQVFLTDSLDHSIYKVNTTGSGSLALVKQFSGAMFGGGLSFSPTGELYVPVATGFVETDTISASLYEFPRSWLDDLAAGHTPSTGPSILASDLHISGTGIIAAGCDGEVYIEASDAIYRVTHNGTLSVFAGDPSINIFTPGMAGAGYMGLTFDPTSENLYYGYHGAATAPLDMTVQATPEPATLAFLGLGAAALAWRRRTHSRG
jgi:DNA-binding beta-propeller fold protein YncE